MSTSAETQCGRERSWLDGSVLEERVEVPARVNRAAVRIAVDDVTQADVRGTMRKKNQIQVIARIPAAPSKWTDTSGNPSESYHWRHMAEVRREWRHQFREAYVNALEPTLFENTSAEMRVRTAPYPISNHQLDNSLASDRARRIA